MNKDKLNSVSKLLKSKMYVLVTETETILHTDFKTMTGVMQISALQQAKYNIDTLLKNLLGTPKKRATRAAPKRSR